VTLGRRFARFYVGSATSNLSDGIGRVVLPLLAASLTRNPLLVSGLTTFAFLPWLLFALPGGALVDRVDRRHAMAVANAVRCAASITLAVLVAAGVEHIVVLYVVAFVLGVAETIYDSAVRALLPQLVSTDDLDRANGLLTVEETLGQTVLGAPAGSALFAIAVSLPLFLNGAGFAIAAILVLTFRGSFRPVRTDEPTTIRRDMADGVRWLLGNRFFRELTAISALTCLLFNVGSAVLVLYSLDVLHLPAGDYGYLLLGMGAGGIIGGTLTPRLAARFDRGLLLTVGAAVCAATTVALAFVRNGYAAGVLLLVDEAAVMIWNVITISLRQSLIPRELFGRVQGSYRTVVWGSIPVGALIGGGLADGFGVPSAYLISGIGQAVMAVALGLFALRHRAALRRGPADAPAVGSAQEVG